MAHAVKERWLRLGRQIRGYRERAGLSQHEVAQKIMVSPTMLSAMERGARGIKREHLERLDKVLGTGGILVDSWDASSGAGIPEWYQDGTERERAAYEIRTYQPLVIPGLLQTERYAHTLLRAGMPTSPAEEIARLVRGRMDRQAVLKKKDPPRLVVAVEETVLRRPFGGRDLMAEQLAHLLEEAQEPHISLHVIPFETEYHPGFPEAFTLYSLHDRPDILYLETRRSSSATTDIGDYARVFRDLLGAALPPSASRELIAQIQGEFS
ncbi:helix-turn-helix transcriptional regulator [Thermobifida alba]|uniref:Helix-turn-helix transcriptional regulator n=1 Tax=Thermobifida alba TaxID=53522 RepID=A0ABY4L0A0_THEAE|nr:helix-turn-helix transcriptional regulator [Thermobifida alba]UPT20361.1 helix-turn-helix transcriptional regulator [Thermobifida alba]